MIFHEYVQKFLFILDSFTFSLKILSFNFESMSGSVCLIQKRQLFGDGESLFLSKASKQEFQLKRELHATCLTPNMPVVSLAQQFRKLNSCICLKYHLSDKLKAQNKFSPITHKLNVFISSARHSSCPYDPVKKMCFILVDFKLDEKIPNTDFFWSVFSCM